ncbi:MAG: type II toxin-antitoxin system VapC family toxin [Planctomycetia bacterium]
MRPKVYVETSIPSYVVSRPSRDLILAARQQLTREWWDRRAAYELCISALVIDECKAGDSQAATARLAVLAGIDRLRQTDDVSALTDSLLNFVPLPKKAAADAEHIAYAAVHGVDYLLTWNCRHLANARLRSPMESVCRDAGFEPPRLCTPEELFWEGDVDG